MESNRLKRKEEKGNTHINPLRENGPVSDGGSKTGQLHVVQPALWIPSDSESQEPKARQRFTKAIFQWPDETPFGKGNPKDANCLAWVVKMVRGYISTGPVIDWMPRKWGKGRVALGTYWNGMAGSTWQSGSAINFLNYFVYSAYAEINT